MPAVQAQRSVWFEASGMWGALAFIWDGFGCYFDTCAEGSDAAKAATTPRSARNIGALIIRIGFGIYYAIHIRRNPQNPALNIKAPI